MYSGVMQNAVLSGQNLREMTNFVWQWHPCSQRKYAAEIFFLGALPFLQVRSRVVFTLRAFQRFQNQLPADFERATQ